MQAYAGSTSQVLLSDYPQGCVQTPDLDVLLLSLGGLQNLLFPFARKALSCQQPSPTDDQCTEQVLGPLL